MGELNKAVFLSYASQDAEAARRICEALRASGLEVWFDQSELRGGDAWDRQIKKQIHDCALFIPIISVNSQIRLEGYFRREWRLAVDRTHDMADSRPFLVPVVIDDTNEQDAEVPESFQAVQWTRLPTGETPPAFIERVTRLLSPGGARASREVSSAVTAAPPAAEPFRRQVASASVSRGSRFVPLLIAAIGLLGVGYFSLEKFVLSKHSISAPRTSASSAILEKSIAVLPFVDMSEKRDQGYFADGIAVAVLDLLSKVPGLRVIGHNSSFQLKEKANDLKTVGAELGAAYIVEGSVHRLGDAIRVTARLIDSRDGVQRWSATYNRKASDVFAVQDEIAANLARTLQLTVGSDFSSRAATTNPDAYDVYLRGLRALDQWSKAGAEEAAGAFQQALTLDPKFARAALGRAKAYRMSGVNEWLPADVAFSKAREAAQLALKLDPSLGDAHAVLGEIALTYDWDAAGSDREIQMAMKLGGAIETLQAAARLAAASNQWAQATDLFQTALAADPLDANLHVLLAWGVDMRSRRYSDAETGFRRALAISPDYGSARWTLGQALMYQNRLEEALDVMQHESPDNGRFEGTAVVYHAMGKKAESDAWMKQAIEHDGELYPSAIAKACAYRGELDQAMKWLDKAFAVKDGDLYFIKYEPLMKNLERDPRYKAFLRKMNLPD